MTTRIAWPQHSEDCITSAEDILLLLPLPFLLHVAWAHMVKIWVGYHRKSSTDIICVPDDEDVITDDNQLLSLSKIDICSREYAQLRRTSISAAENVSCCIPCKKDDSRPSTRIEL